MYSGFATIFLDTLFTVNKQSRGRATEGSEDMLNIYPKDGKYYVLVIPAGCSPFESGPYETYQEAYQYAQVYQDINRPVNLDNGCGFPSDPSFGG